MNDISLKGRRIMPPTLNRYTSLPVALDVLARKRITLLSPETWEDRNDAFFIERYRKELNLKTVLAICFSMDYETFHHWRIFASGFAGICIEFARDALLARVSGLPGFVSRNVTYKYVSELQKQTPDITDWPFIKRKPFEAEGEYRILYESRTDEMTLKHVTIDLAIIDRVVLSPWLAKPVAESVVSTIRRIPGCARLDVERSSLLDNADWRSTIE